LTSILEEHDGLIAFGNGDYSRRAGGYAFRTRFGDLPADDLAGYRVNLGTKNGEVIEATTITAVDRDELVLDGGRIGWPYQPSQEPEPLTPALRLAITEIARGFTRPVVNVEAIRKLLSGTVELRYRFSGSLHHVAGYGEEYSAIVSLSNYLRHHPADASEVAGQWARDGLEQGSTSTCVQRADLIEAILAVLDGIEHDGPPYVIDAMRVYLRVLRGQDDPA
jgi:hypothetical protein